MDKSLTEQEEINKTRVGIRLMKVDVLEIRTDITLIKTALIGSELTKDGGLIKRVIETEINVAELTLRMTKMEEWQALQKDKETRKKERLKRWKWIGGVALAAAITAIITILFQRIS